MLIYWYWPHRHQGVSEGAVALAQDEDVLVVQALGAYDGVPTAVRIDEYEVVRDLPDPVVRGGRLTRSVRSALNAVGRQRRRARLVLERRPEVCYLGVLEPELDIFVLPVLRRLGRTATVGMAHDIRPHVARWPRVVETFLLRCLYSSWCLDVIVVLHESLADELEREFGVKRERIAVKPMGLRRTRSTRTRPGEPFNVLFFGSFRANKGIPVLAEAIRQIGEDERVRFIFAGAGDPDLEEVVRILAEERADVFAEIGRVSDARREELLASADLLVLPYTSFHSQSGVLEDAYERAIPLLVTDVGAIGPTVLADGSGWVVPPGDAPALAETMKVAWQDSDGYRSALRQVEAASDAHGTGPATDALRHAFDVAVARRGVRQ